MGRCVEAEVFSVPVVTVMLSGPGKLVTGDEGKQGSELSGHGV